MNRTARILSHGVRGLARNRVRTFFMMLGTFIGVAALTVIVAIGSGTQRDMLRRIDRMLSGSTILLRAGGGQVRGGAHMTMRSTTLTLDDVRAIDDALPGVVAADAFIMSGARDVVYDGRNARISVQGHSDAAEVAWNRSVTRGAYFTAADVASAARVALIGEVVARDLFAGRDPIGEQIRVGAVPFHVIGVLERVGLDPHGIDKDNEIIIPVTTMMRRVLNIDYVMGAKLSLRPESDLDNAVLEATDILRARHGLAPDQANDFALFTPVHVNEMVKSANRVFTVFLPLVASISLLVGGLVVANLMLMTVHERRSEIGLRQAVGARARDIRLQFLMESAAVTALGGLVALPVGWMILQVMLIHGGPAGRMPWSAAAVSLSAAVVVGVVAGVAPARRAAALDPVQTLR